jgi:hypothetical protein
MKNNTIFHLFFQLAILILSCYQICHSSSESFGSAYRFINSDGRGWSNSAILKPPDGNSGSEYFGGSISFYNPYVIVGDFRHCMYLIMKFYVCYNIVFLIASFGGAAYLFYTNDNGQSWSIQARLIPSAVSIESDFGFAVFASEYTIIITDPAISKLYF